MAKTQTKQTEKTKIAEEAKNAGAVATTQPKGELISGLRPRLAYPRHWCEHFGITAYAWVTLTDAVWPGAKSAEAVCMAIAYCKARGLDPMKKPVHIVPVYSKAVGGEVETVWPAITEVRITATRTGVYAGKDAMEVGDIIKRKFSHEHDGKTVEKEIEFPEWMRLTVYKIVQGVRCPFVGPKVFWLEAYASQSKWSEVPNDMWAGRPSGQLEKCTEAASLRAAFPEELGDAYVPEEMAGRTIEGHPPGQPHIDLGHPEHVSPPENKNSEFKREEPKEGDAKKAAPAQTRTDMVDVPAEEEDQDRGPAPAEEAQDAPRDGDPAGDAGRKILEDWLQEQVDFLAELTSVPQVATARNAVAEQLKPGSDHAKRWHQACDDRQRAILDATRKK